MISRWGLEWGANGLWHNGAGQRKVDVCLSQPVGGVSLWIFLDCPSVSVILHIGNLRDKTARCQ